MAYYWIYNAFVTNTFKLNFKLLGNTQVKLEIFKKIIDFKSLFN
jgi:hypothetical protein